MVRDGRYIYPNHDRNQLVCTPNLISMLWGQLQPDEVLVNCLLDICIRLKAGRWKVRSQCWFESLPWVCMDFPLLIGSVTITSSLAMACRSSSTIGPCTSAQENILESHAVLMEFLCHIQNDVRWDWHFLWRNLLWLTDEWNQLESTSILMGVFSKTGMRYADSSSWSCSSNGCFSVAFVGQGWGFLHIHVLSWL